MVSPTRKFLYTPFKIIISIAFLSVSRPVFCGELLKEQSIEYRQKGYEAQKAGMLGEALTYYQKAMQLDPSSALIYNDLGVIHEMTGELAIAEEAYRRALYLNPGYDKAYFNLAQLYEEKGDLFNAAEYWLKLLRIDNVREDLVKKAEKRIYEIGKVIPEVRNEYMRAEVSSLDTQVVSFKNRLSSDDTALAQFYIETAEVFVKRKEYVKALKLYLDAKHLDPRNDQVDSLIERTQKKILL